MLVEDHPTTDESVNRIGRLLGDTSARLHRAHALCNRVHDRLVSLFEAGEGDAEDGWRRFH